MQAEAPFWFFALAETPWFISDLPGYLSDRRQEVTLVGGLL